MLIIDSQVHAYEANTPRRPWHNVPNWPDHVTGDEMVAAMDKVGVDGAIFISPFSLYRYDGSYAVEVQRAHPDRFAIIKPVDPDDPAVADVVAEWKNTPGAVAIRIMLTEEAGRAPDDPGLDRILRAAVRYDFSRQHPVLGQLGPWCRAHGAPSRHALYHRSSGSHAAAGAAGAAAALGRPPQGTCTRQISERDDQSQRRLYALPRALPLPGHLGPVGARVRCLGFRALPVGHGLDARICCRQLRAGHKALR
jgi:hypothetical protein